MCSERSRTRRAVGSCERSASCGRAPRSACRTWPTTFAAWRRWNGSPRHEGGGVVCSVPTEAVGAKRSREDNRKQDPTRTSAQSGVKIEHCSRCPIVSSTDLYGGTWNLFANTLSSMGITVRFADPIDPDNFRRATDARTRAYYAETLPNPKLQVFPISEVAAIGRELGVPLIMDNTAAPVICRPLDHGAAIVVHSTTKYIGGHGTSIGGIIVDGGNFDWAAHSERFPALNKPDPGYHGAIWTEAVKPLGPIAYIIRARVVLLRDIGAC